MHRVGHEGRKRTMEGGHESPGVWKKKVKPCLVTLEQNDINMKRRKVTVIGYHSGSEKRENGRSGKAQKLRMCILIIAIIKPIIL